MLRIKPFDRQLIGLNNNFSKLKKLLEEVRENALRQLLRQVRKRE
jgi:hypothetical protein